MDADIKKLKEAYIEKKREASSLSEKRQIRHDYKVMKKKLKDANRIIKKNNLLESPDEFWDKFDFPSFDDYKKNNIDIETDESLKEMNESLEASKQQFEEQKKNSDEVIRQADETIKQIDKKLAELDRENNDGK